MQYYSSTLNIPRPKKRKRADPSGAYYPDPTQTSTNQDITVESPVSNENGMDTPLHPDLFSDDFNSSLPDFNVRVEIESPLDVLFDGGEIFPDDIIYSPPPIGDELFQKKIMPFADSTSRVLRPPPPPAVKIENTANTFVSVNDLNLNQACFHEDITAYKLYPRVQISTRGLMGSDGNYWILKKKTELEVDVTYQGDPQGQAYFLHHCQPQIVGFGLPRTRMKKKGYADFQSSVSGRKESGEVLITYLDGTSVMNVEGRTTPEHNVARVVYRIKCDVGSNQSGDWRFKDGYRIGFCLMPGSVWFFTEPFKVKSRKPADATRRRKKKMSSSEKIEEEEEEEGSMLALPPRRSHQIEQLTEFPIQTDKKGTSRMMCFVHMTALVPSGGGGSNFQNEDVKISPRVFEYPEPTVPMWYGRPYVGYTQLFPDGMLLGNNDREGWQGSLLLRNAHIRVVLGNLTQKRFFLKLRLGRCSVINIVNNPQWSITHEGINGEEINRPFMGGNLQVGRESSYLPPARDGQVRVSKVHLRIRVLEADGVMEIEDCSKNGTEVFLPAKIIVGDGVRYFVSFYRKMQTSVQERRYKIVVSKKKMGDSDDDTLTLQDD